VLIDRIWPRGVTKEQLRLDDWLKNMAPSTELRKWFGHDPAKWLPFKHRYFRELAEHSDAIKTLRARSRAKTLTLIFAAKDTQHNNAVALKEYLERRARKGGRPAPD
jgi:uncharacterized protein YeaO (DUF488 family)